MQKLEQVNSNADGNRTYGNTMFIKVSSHLN